MEDISVVEEELAEKRQALEALQRNFDDFQESSRELEEELEAELGRTQDQVSELTNRLAEVAGRLGEQQAKNRALGGEVAVAQAETARLKAAAARAAAEKTSLEQAADELEARCRAAIAAEEDSRHKLDLAIEEKIFVSNDLEDLRAETLRTEQKLRSDIDDLRQELGRLGSSNGDRDSGRPSGTPPRMVLPTEVSSLSDADDGNINTNADIKTAVGGDRLLLTVQGLGDDDLDEARGEEDEVGEDGDGIADELIRALEEEIEGLKAELVSAEAANDELNLELQEMQEREIARGGGGAGSSADTSASGEGKNAARANANGSDEGVSPRTQAEQVTLKQDLADAMATCEELDQTVSDLTDDLHAKDEQRCVLEARVAELEADLSSKTQSLGDQVLEAKTNASSLTAKLADTEAELRAATSRVEDVSAKAKVSQNREEVLREETASMRERLSELTTTVSDLSDDLRERETQLEEAQAAAEGLRGELPDLRQSVETLSARLAEEEEARNLAERAASEREEALRGELRAANEAAAAAAMASEPSDAPSGGPDPELAAAVGSGGPADESVGEGEGAGDGEGSQTGLAEGGLLEKKAGGGQKEGQSSGEPGAGPVEREREGGADDNSKSKSKSKSAVHLGAGGDAEARTAEADDGARERERELGEEVDRLRAALEEAQKDKENEKQVASVTDVGVKGASVAEVLENGDLDALKSELRAVAELYGKERGTNASLLSKIRALKGNIEVICRIRPPTAEEKASGVPMALEALGEGEVGVKTSGRHGGGGGGPSSWRSFALDKALGPSTTQEEVFRQVEPLALSAADGMNACIFAYGQTGSGKTHTMIGDAKGGEMAGVSYRTMNKLFQVLELRRRQQPDYVFTVKVAMLEIYNEDVRDLLSESSSSVSPPASGGSAGDVGAGAEWGSGALNAAKLEIRRDQDGRVQVPGLTQVVVSSAEEVLSLLERGGGARAVAATGVHDYSSRSHSVLLAEVACRAGPDALPATGRLFLVDLAGSERVKVSGVTGVGLREATNINSSLSALGDVMQALDQKQKHVPYRNSKLTFLLQDALGGNSRTAMVVTVCPTTLNVDETLFALQFATRARNVSLGPAHKNVGAKNLLEEGKDLRAKLREAGRKKEHAEEALATLQREHARSQQKMGALLESRVKNVGDLRQQLEHQIDSLKSQLEASQANVLSERNKRAALETETEDIQRQLKRSMAKVQALGRDREDREVMLRAKQEEVGELKAELRKVMSEAKNAERRMSAGRRGVGGVSAFGFKAKGGDGGGVAPGKGVPHTPSKKLSEAKNRYTRHRQSTPGRRPPSIGGVSPNTQTSSPAPAPAAPVSVTATASTSTSSGGASNTPATKEERGGSVLVEAGGRSSEAAAAPTAELAAAAVPLDAGRDAAAETNAAGDGPPEAAAAAAAAAGGAVSTDGDSADDVADAIARATAGFASPDAAKPTSTKGKAGQETDNGFAKPKPRLPGGGRGDVAAGKGDGGGDQRTSSSGRARAGGVSSSLMRGTASSSSRLKLNVPSALDEDKVSGLSRSGSAPRSARRPSTGVTPRSTSTPRGFPSSSSSSRGVPPSPANSRLSRPSSFAASSGSTKPKTPRTRNSLSGPVGAAAAAAAAAASASASRRSTVQPPPSPAHRGGSSGTGGPSSSRSIPSFSTRNKGWLGEKSRSSVSGGAGTASSRGSSSSTSSGGGGGVQRKAAGGAAAAGGGEQLSRAQIALNRHQERMDRIREKREERMGGKGKDGSS
eukprot:g4614.t1